MHLKPAIGVGLIALTAFSSARNLPHHTSSIWKRVTNKVIATFWDIPLSNPETHHKTAKALPTSLLAQYDEDVVLRFNVSTKEEVESIQDAVSTLLLDVWSFTQESVDIRLAESLVPSLLGLLPTSLHHSHKPMLRRRDLVEAIYNTYTDAAPKETSFTSSALRHADIKLGTKSENNVFFQDYQPLSVIVPWMRLLSSLFTTHTSLIQIGTTAEGRDIHALRIGVHPTNRQVENLKRKTIVVAAGLHAREWISTSTASYIAYSLITSYGKSASITDLLEAFDFVIIPTLNPDGYAYTWDTDRLWRKNRQKTALRFCQGIDLDHSFGFEWDGDATAGNACSEAYAGEKPFQAIEAEQLATWAKNQSETVDFVSFIDLHSYSQQILYPYGFSCDAAPPGLEDLEELAFGLEKAIRVSHGHDYEVMSACEGNTAWIKNKKQILPYVESPGGSALDYFYHELHARWSYQIKLRDKGTYGFLLPREHIIPTGKETFDAILYLGSFLTDSYDIKHQTNHRLDDSAKQESVIKLDLR